MMWHPFCGILFGQIYSNKKQFQDVVSSHPDPIPVLLSVKLLQEQLVLLKGKAAN